MAHNYKKATRKSVRVYRRDVSREATAESGESISIPVGNAGDVVDFNIAIAPITNSAGSEVGFLGDTSIALTSTAFTTEVKPKADSELSNGEYWVDYESGECRGKKADNSTSGSADYKYFSAKGGGSGGGDASAANQTTMIGHLAPPSAISHGNKTVTTAGTPVALATTTACKKVFIQALKNNVGKIAVGGTGVDAGEGTGTGVLLEPGDVIDFEIDDLADIFIDSTVSGEGVRYTYLTA